MVVQGQIVKSGNRQEAREQAIWQAVTTRSALKNPGFQCVESTSPGARSRYCSGERPMRFCPASVRMRGRLGGLLKHPEDSQAQVVGIVPGRLTGIAEVAIVAGEPATGFVANASP